MPYDTGLAERLAEIFADRFEMEEKKMFGGIGWLLNGNMCVGVYKDWLIVRVGEEREQALLGKPHVRQMDITGKPMKGWAMISSEGLEEDMDLRSHVDMALEFVNGLPPK
jgi:hypothetical protein